MSKSREPDLGVIADEIAIEAGAIERCAEHDQITIDRYDENAQRRAYAIGATRVDQGHFDCTHEEMQGAIQAAIAAAAHECPRCKREQRGSD